KGVLVVCQSLNSPHRYSSAAPSIGGILNVTRTSVPLSGVFSSMDSSSVDSRPQDLAQLLRECLLQVRLLHEPGKTTPHELLDRLLLAVPAAQQHFHVRVEGAHAPKRLLTVHLWHRQVKHHAKDLVHVRAVYLQG